MRSIEDFPPFPDDLHSAPIARVSSAALLAKEDAACKQVLEACQTYGFFYLDLRDSAWGRQLLEEASQLYDVATNAFKMPLAEKMTYHLQKGISLFGYKAAGTVKQTDKEQRPDLTEFFNVAKDHLHGVAPTRDYPPAIEAARSLLKDFTTRAHATGMLVLSTLARQLDVPEHTFLNLNLFDKEAGDHCRLTHTPLPLADADPNGVGLPSHTDFGSVTVLFNWLGGLQIQSRHPDRSGEWEFVKPLEGHAVINLGDAMVKFTNGALKSAKHRVVPAPGEQGKLERISVVYFVRPHNAALMKPAAAKFETGDHVKVGGKVSVGDDESKVYTAGEWMIKRSIQLMGQ
jgi:isopenicillin N synthase-like dioxygenase